MTNQLSYATLGTITGVVISSEGIVIVGSALI